MKHFLSSFALSLGLVAPVLAACSGATVDDPSGSTSGASSTGDDATADSDVTSGKKKSCAAVGGSCVGLSPSSCTGGYFADAAKVSCGAGVGAACCVACPVLSAPAPGFCTGGTIVSKKDENGCATGFDCEMPPQECPELSPPAPGFCTGGTVVARKDPKTGCTTGFDCIPGPGNACTAAGGTCVGLSPAACPGGQWGDASTHSCGGGIGVGCCLP
jgi:hypothetical protein